MDLARFEEIRSRAHKGHPDASFVLGLTYASLHQCVPQDFAMAAKYFERAARAGHVGAAYQLGMMYAQGDQLPQDHARATEYLRQAADKGHLQAKAQLGILQLGGFHRQGIDVDRAFVHFRDYALAALRDERADMESHHVLFYPVMLASGFGCKQDVALAREIMSHLVQRGFRHARLAVETGRLCVSVIHLIRAAGMPHLVEGDSYHSPGLKELLEGKTDRRIGG